jgi:hypothetical protein
MIRRCGISKGTCTRVPIIFQNQYFRKDKMNLIWRMTSITAEKTAKELAELSDDNNRIFINQGYELNGQMPPIDEKATSAWQLNTANNVPTTRSDMLPVLAQIHERKRKAHEQQLNIMVSLNNSEKRRRILTDELNRTIAERNYVINCIKHNAPPQPMLAGSNLIAHNLQGPILHAPIRDQLKSSLALGHDNVISSVRHKLQDLYCRRLLQQERESRAQAFLSTNVNPFGPINPMCHQQSTYNYGPIARISPFHLEPFGARTATETSTIIKAAVDALANSI